MLIKITRCKIMAQTEQLRDWNPADGLPTSELSERRDFIPKTRR
jgi:hypothetical protein